MTDVNKLHSLVNRGERAKRIMEEEFVKEAFDKIESTLMDAWRQSASDETGARDNAYIMYRLLQNFKQQFVIAITTGEVSRKELLSIEDPSKLMRALRF